MLRFFGASFIALWLLTLCTAGVYTAQTGTVNLYECAELECPYISEVGIDEYYFGIESEGWVTLMSTDQAVQVHELELQFLGVKLFEMSWVHWLLLAWLVYIAATSIRYRMRYDILDMRFKTLQDELSEALVELAKYKGSKEF